MLDRKAARSKSVPAPDIPGVEFARTVLALLEDEFDADAGGLRRCRWHGDDGDADPCRVVARTGMTPPN